MKDIQATTNKDLIDALKKMPIGGSWQVESGPFGHASILVFDKDGKMVAVIRNK